MHSIFTYVFKGHVVDCYAVESCKLQTFAHSKQSTTQVINIVQPYTMYHGHLIFLKD